MEILNKHNGMNFLIVCIHW